MHAYGQPLILSEVERLDRLAACDCRENCDPQRQPGGGGGDGRAIMPRIDMDMDFGL